MRRSYSPFNNKQYVLNKNTGEIHNLDNEKSECKIDDIKLEHICSSNSYEELQATAVMLTPHQPDGCFYCLKTKNTG